MNTTVHNLILLAGLSLAASTSQAQLFKQAEDNLEHARVEVIYDKASGRGTIIAHDDGCPSCSPRQVPFDNTIHVTDQAGTVISFDDFRKWSHVYADVFIRLDTKLAVRVQRYE